MTTPGALLQTMRPRQWVKNVLVVAAPLAAGAAGDPAVLTSTLLAFVSFCLAASAIYLVNDCADVAADRLHPLKRKRPVASGALPVRRALLLAAFLAVCALGVAALARWELVLIVASYVAMMVLYSYWLKHEPVVDLLLVAGGFLMRAVAGGLASGLPISDWFLLVAGFGSLFVVAGKRYSELHTLGSEAGTRKSLVRYTASYLRFSWGVAAAVTITGYCLWAFENSNMSSVLPWHKLSIVLFVAGILRYAVDVDAGTAAEPEDIVWRDRVLQGIGVGWVALVALGVAGV
ncbi:decaprenyl-phosphate phosphoribosyltransferase [Nocardioides sp. YIM 152315]|uniref:decaprenyl-phosphate phosphoribosyltransferase n=1 Tax=Nocardioides sp. YIM 152315 TaxID=3031760 RepID=UPI0023D9B9C7|nr:decaprenyl-phosphate phosphoribosyltransferase [Nocardioides sp. YIM 152315]MDF1603130.1 decaprenyl-phosphate phosphoribosyltransferase [Nocardioides sp. YIM 152315]